MNTFTLQSFAAPRGSCPANCLIACANKGDKTQLGARMKPLAWVYV